MIHSTVEATLCTLRSMSHFILPLTYTRFRYDSTHTSMQDVDIVVCCKSIHILNGHNNCYKLIICKAGDTSNGIVTSFVT